jgi:hypothetical protein
MCFTLSQFVLSVESNNEVNGRGKASKKGTKLVSLLGNNVDSSAKLFQLARQQIGYGWDN